MGENRHHFRKETNRPVIFVLRGGDRRSGICRNISLGGLLVETTEPAPFGADITIYIELDDVVGRAALPGVVRWTTSTTMGIQLGLFGVRITHAILRILALP